VLYDGLKDLAKLEKAKHKKLAVSNEETSLTKWGMYTLGSTKRVLTVYYSLHTQISWRLGHDCAYQGVIN